MLAPCRAASLVAVLVLGLAAPARADGEFNIALGNPSRATDDPGNRDNFLVVRKQYALSYHNSRGIPNWVSWRLVRDDLGNAPRKQFHPDTALPRGFKHVSPGDYTDSGFDRGHMCPHGDRAHTPEDTAATFAMSNIVPQAPELNQHPWNDLENYCRDLVRRQQRRLYIICGPQGDGGTGKHGFKTTIGRDKVAVPARCWKVIVSLPEGDGNDLERITGRTRVIAVVMPNKEKLDRTWAHYRTSVKKIEDLTRLTFFDKLPAELADRLKEKVDDVEIHTPRTQPRD